MGRRALILAIGAATLWSGACGSGGGTASGGAGGHPTGGAGGHPTGGAGGHPTGGGAAAGAGGGAATGGGGGAATGGAGAAGAGGTTDGGAGSGAGAGGHPAGGGGAGAGGTTDGGAGGAAGAGGAGPCCSDLGGGPLGPDGTAGSVPAGAATIFGKPSGGAGGPCLYEPQDGTLFPNNWLRPRFSWTATGDLYALEVSGGNQIDPLVVYTNQTSWTMPAQRWAALARDTQDMPLTVTIRSSSGGGAPVAGTTTAFKIAPVAAPGSIAYFSPTRLLSAGSTLPGPALNGFAAGSEVVEELLVPSDVLTSDWQTYDQGLNRRAVSCIGCHTETPDGDVSFNDFYPWGGVIASLQETNLGRAPTFLGAGGYDAFTQPWVGQTTYSPAHWTDGDHIAVAPLGTTITDNDQQPGLAWFDLESTAALPQGQNPFTVLRGTAWDWIYQPAAGAYAAAPSWSHAGNFVVFTMTSNVVSGHPGTGTSHLYRVPYSKTGPQAATPIAGDGSSSSWAQYDGALSGDDTLIVYDQVLAATAANAHRDLNTTDTCTGGPPCSWPGMYMQPDAELYVIPPAGGTAVRLAANDPPACAGQPASPGIDNARARWAPDATTAANGNTYYWLVFSSWRQGETDTSGEPLEQLFITAVVKTELGLQTYPAIYLWNQPADAFNGTPAWGPFPVPAVTTP